MRVHRKKGEQKKRVEERKWAVAARRRKLTLKRRHANTDKEKN